MDQLSKSVGRGSKSASFVPPTIGTPGDPHAGCAVARTMPPDPASSVGPERPSSIKAKRRRFQDGYGPWAQYLQLDKVHLVDFHRGRRAPGKAYWDVMADVHEEAFAALQYAQANGFRHVVYVHGWSTSGPGKTTSRSVIRGLMRSPDATPHIVRAACIQHETCFVAAIRPAPVAPRTGGSRHA